MTDALETLTAQRDAAQAIHDDLWSDLTRLVRERETLGALLVSTPEADRTPTLTRLREVSDALSTLPSMLAETGRRLALADLALASETLTQAEMHFTATREAYDRAGSAMSALRREAAAKQAVVAGGRPSHQFAPYARQDESEQRQADTVAWHAEYDASVSEAAALNRRIEAEYNPRELQRQLDLATGRLSAARCYGSRYGFPIVDAGWRNPAAWPGPAHRCGEAARREALRLVAGG